MALMGVFMVIKYTTENLICFFAKDKKGQGHYQIFEKENLNEPIAIYVNIFTIHLSNRFPQLESEYQYFDEMCEIITMLYELGE